jgi:excisionase family DNA binding protein
MDAPLLRVYEAARVLKVSKWTVYRWIEEGRLEATKIGRGSLRIFRASVEALIESNRTQAWRTSGSVRGNVVRLPSAGAKKMK